MTTLISREKLSKNFGWKTRENIGVLRVLSKLHFLNKNLTFRRVCCKRFKFSQFWQRYESSLQFGWNFVIIWSCKRIYSGFNQKVLPICSVVALLLDSIVRRQNPFLWWNDCWICSTTGTDGFQLTRPVKTEFERDELRLIPEEKVQKIVNLRICWQHRSFLFLIFAWILVFFVDPGKLNEISHFRFATTFFGCCHKTFEVILYLLPIISSGWMSPRPKRN